MPLKLVKRGQYWHIHGTIAGQHIRESTRLSQKGAAQRRLLLRQNEIIQRHSLGRAATTTFAEAALAYMQAGGEGRFLPPILEHFGESTLLTEIDGTAANACAAAVYPHAGPATVNRQVITPISAVVNAALADSGQPPRRFRRRKEPAGRLRWLTPEEAKRLLDAADPRTRRWIMFLLGTGCRPIETFELEVADLHLATCEAWIWRSKTDVPRMVWYPPIVRAALGQVGDASHVFLTPKGQPYKIRTGSGGQAAEAFKRVREAAGLDESVTPYVCRHTWATWFYAATRDFGALMDLGGWAKADTANRYRKIAPADLGDRLITHGWHFDTFLAQRPIREAASLNKSSVK